MARILITGSNSGFGLLSALTLARQGHDVIATMQLAKSDAGLPSPPKNSRSPNERST